LRYPSLSIGSLRTICAAVQRERAALRYGPARASRHWILEASNILAAMKKALHPCKALIVLAFLAPRPGLEPGTYGLTGGRSDRAAGRAKAHFQGVRTSNTFASVSSISTGRELRIDYWILESSPPRMPGCSAALFLDLRHGRRAAVAFARGGATEERACEHCTFCGTYALQ
jgi:hypothetical protein